MQQKVPIRNHGTFSEHVLVTRDKLIHQTCEIALHPNLWYMGVQKPTHNLAHESPNVAKSVRHKTFHTKQRLHANQVIKRLCFTVVDMIRKTLLTINSRW